jgi:repressor LexA
VAKPKTITDRILQFVAFKGLSDREFCKKADLSSTYLTALKNGTTPGIDHVQKILSAFPELSDVWIYTEQGSMLKGYADLGTNKPSILTETRPKLNPPDKTVISIPIVDIKAAAGDGYLNVEDLTPEDFIHVPSRFLKYKGAPHICVRANGPSMNPTVQDGSWLPLSLLDKSQWADMPDNQCYVITDKEEKTYFKRIKNRAVSRGQITLSSDNPDKLSHPNFDKLIDEIHNIWYVEFVINFRLINIHDQFYSRLERLENQVDELSQKFLGQKS